MGTSYPPFPSWAVTFCWVPLWFFCLQQDSLKKAFWGGWWTQFVLSLIGFHWVAYTSYAFGGLPIVVSGLALFLFASLVHLHIPLSVWLINKVRGNQIWTVPTTFLAYALTMALAERVWPMIFPWHLGYSFLYSRLEIYNLAEFIGFSGLSSLLFGLNALMATGLWFWKQHKIRAAMMLSSAVGLFFVLNIAGSLLRPKDPPQKTVKALVIQANIGQFEKITAEKNLKAEQGDIQKAVMKLYFELTDEALKQLPEAEMIVWPETALADYLDIEYLSRPRQLELRAKIAEWNRALVTGAYSKNVETQDVYNGLFFFGPQGNLTSPAYRKSILLAFGERLPFGDVFPWLYKLLPFVSSFAQGPGPEVRKLQLSKGELSVAPQICYEGLYADFNRKAVLQGADLLINVTNDSWFGELFEPYQHATMTWARAIETRRPLIRSTNTGQSSVFTHQGKVLFKSPLDDEWFGLAEIPIPERKITFYMKYGYLDWTIYLVILLGLIWRAKTHARKISEKPLI